MSADMSDSVKQKKPIPLPLFYRGFFISYTGHLQLKRLLSIEGCESFLKVQDVQWICCPCQKWWVLLLAEIRGALGVKSHIKQKKDPTNLAESLSIIGARDENRTRTGMNPEGF